jgi:hypothetical protein
MTTINVFENGDIVKVINNGCRYTTYQSAYKFVGYLYTDVAELGYKELQEGYLYTVVSTLIRDEKVMTFIKDKSGFIYLIGNAGLELHVPQEEKWA